MSRDLAPPIFMRHMQHSKDPLPAIGHTPLRTSLSSSSVTSTPAGSPQAVAHGGNADDSPHRGLEDSPTVVVGSLAVARRRARKEQEAPGGNSPEMSMQFGTLHDPPLHRAPSPLDVNGGVPPQASGTSPVSSMGIGANEELTTGRPKATHRTCAALLDVLDPDTDGSTIVDVTAPPFGSMGFQPSTHNSKPPGDDRNGHTMFQRGFQ